MFTPLTPLRCLHRAVDLYGHKEAIVCGAQRLSYAQFGDRCERLADSLRASGLAGRDRVAYLSFNTHQLLEGYFGVIQAGGIVMPLNVRLTTLELTQILNHSGARFLFYETEFEPLVSHFRAACPKLEVYVCLGPNYEQLLAQATPARANIYEVAENATAELFYTSGSTGSPKGVSLSHRTLYLHALSVAAVFHHDDSAVELHTIPLFHANGWGRPQSTTLMGGKHVMVRRFDPAAVLSLIESERATAMSLVPTMANALLNCPDIGKHNLSSLKEIHLGGAASTPHLIGQLEKAFGCPAMAGYGLTETAPIASSARPKATFRPVDEADRLAHQAMAGWPLPGVEARVVDAEMRDVPRDGLSVGEIVIRGDHVMEGYFEESDATEAVMSGQWFHTGDMAVWDSETYLNIVDRKKDIIISGGENISSLELEREISAHPSVLECAVVAAPDEKWGEIPIAYIVWKPGCADTPEKLIEFLLPRVARFKLPRRFECVAGPLPKTGTGKIVKRELREPFWIGKTNRVQG